MSIEITFLGTGGSWPSSERNVLSVGIRLDGQVILFDCGEGTQRQLMLSNLSFMSVSRVFISHFHGDHFLGLAGMMQSMALNDREDELYIYGPPGTIGFIKNLANAGYFGVNFPVIVEELEAGDHVRFDRFNVRPIVVDHSVPTLGYILEEDERPGRFDRPKAEELGVPPGPLFKKLHEGEDVEVDGRVVSSGDVVGPPRPGMKIVFSGDTRPVGSLTEAARGADVLIHEATMMDDLREKAHRYGHSTARDAAELARDAGVRYLFLVHLSPRYKDPEPVLKEARAIFENSHVPDDLSEFMINYSDQMTSNSS
jgi:ribonuclease Z